MLLPSDWVSVVLRGGGGPGQGVWAGRGGAQEGNFLVFGCRRGGLWGGPPPPPPPPGGGGVPPCVCSRARAHPKVSFFLFVGERGGVGGLAPPPPPPPGGGGDRFFWGGGGGGGWPQGPKPRSDRKGQPPTQPKSTRNLSA